MSETNGCLKRSGQSIDRRTFCMLTAGAAAAGVRMTAATPAFAADEKAPEGDDNAPLGDGQGGVPPVFVVDRLASRPGDGPALLEEYLSYYAPLAEECGAELVATRVAPPCWLDTDSNTLEFTWKVAGIGGCWGIDSPLRANPEVVQWWRDLRDRVVSQDRSYFADPADMEVLCNV